MFKKFPKKVTVIIPMLLVLVVLSGCSKDDNSKLDKVNATEQVSITEAWSNESKENAKEEESAESPEKPEINVNGDLTYTYEGYRYTLKSTNADCDASQRSGNTPNISVKYSEPLIDYSDYFVVQSSFYGCGDFSGEGPLLIKKETGKSVYIDLTIVGMGEGIITHELYGDAVRKEECGESFCRHFHDKQFQFIGVKDGEARFAEWKITNGNQLTELVYNDFGGSWILKQPNNFMDSTEKFQKRGEFVREFGINLSKVKWEKSSPLPLEKELAG